MSSSTGTYWEAARVPPSVFYDRLIAFDASYYEEIRVGFAMPQNQKKLNVRAWFAVRLVSLSFERFQLLEYDTHLH